MEGGQKIITPKGKIHNVSSKIQNYQISLAIIIHLKEINHLYTNYF